MDRVSKEIRRQTLQDWWLGITQSKFVIGFVLLIGLSLGWNIYKAGDRVSESKVVAGKIVGVHQIQGNTGSSVSMLAVRLESGETQMVVQPIGFIVKADETVRLSMSATEQGSVHYRLLGYLEASSNGAR